MAILLLYIWLMLIPDSGHKILPTIDIIKDALCFSLFMFKKEVVRYPLHKMIFKCSLYHLME